MAGDEAADWSRVTGTYAQGVRCTGTEDPYLPPAIPAFLAELLGRVSASYQGREDDFLAHATEAIQAVDGGELTSNDLYYDTRFIGHPSYIWHKDARRRPSPFESLIETGRRLRDLNEIESRVANTTRGGIVGGSMSYGRFFNVKGNFALNNRQDEASDIDLLLVASDLTEITATIAGLSGVPGASREDLAIAEKRVQAYAQHTEGRSDGANVVFSQKLRMWTDSDDKALEGIEASGAYHISLHIFDVAAFQQLMFKDVPEITSAALGESGQILDFRESRADRKDLQRSFSGLALHLDLPSTELADGSILRVTSRYCFRDGRFYPGMFQNLVLPGFNVQWSDRDTRRLVEAFRWKMVDRLRLEQRELPDELLRLSFSHTRSDVFSPHIVRSIDSSTYLS
jgi:hypothetical protein